MLTVVQADAAWVTQGQLPAVHAQRPAAGQRDLAGESGFWLNEAASIGAVACHRGWYLPLVGMSQWIHWEAVGVFENIGTVQDGINPSHGHRLCRTWKTAPDLKVDRGEIRFLTRCSLHYGKDQGVFDGLDLDHQARRKKTRPVGRSGGGQSTLVQFAAAFHDCGRWTLLIDGLGETFAEVNQESLRPAYRPWSPRTHRLLHRRVTRNIPLRPPGWRTRPCLIKGRRAGSPRAFHRGAGGCQRPVPVFDAPLWRLNAASTLRRPTPAYRQLPE